MGSETKAGAGETSLAGQLPRFVSVVALAVALGAFLYNVWVSRLMPSLSADSLIYHLTIPAFWTQQGFLRTVDLPFHDGAAEHSPLITEVILYGLMKLAGNDDLAWLVQPAFFLLTVSLFYRSLRLLAFPAEAARFLAAFLVLFSPFFHSSLIVNSEMVMTAGIALFVFGMLLTRTRPEAGCMAAAGGIALALASKTVAVIYGGAALLILAGWFAFAARRKPEPEKPFRWRGAGLVSLVLILAGLSFHGRNLWQHGNPLYPAEVRLLGLTLLPGRYDASVFINHGWSPAALAKMLVYDSESFAMSRQFGILLWLAMLAPLVLLALRRLRPDDLLPGILFVAYPLACIVAYFAVVPFWSEHRLLFPVYYLLWCGLGCSLHLLTRESGSLGRRILTTVLGLAFVAQAGFFLAFDESPFVLLAACAVAGIVLANDPRVLEWSERRPWVVPLAAVILAFAGSPWWLPRLAKAREQMRGTAYARIYGPLGHVWSGLEVHTRDKPVTVAYSGSALVYPLFGSRHANRPVYLPLSPDDQPLPLSLTGDESIYRQLSRQRRRRVDEQFWLAQLQEKEVDYLLLMDDPKCGGVKAERELAERHPELLKLVSEGPQVWMYAVQKPAGP